MVDKVDQEHNPIKEADKESIDRLFNLDPQFLTRENIGQIVAKLRANRANWTLEAKAKTKGTRGKVSADAAKDLLAQFALKM